MTNSWLHFPSCSFAAASCLFFSSCSCNWCTSLRVLTSTGAVSSTYSSSWISCRCESSQTLIWRCEFGVILVNSWTVGCFTLLMESVLLTSRHIIILKTSYTSYSNRLTFLMTGPQFFFFSYYMLHHGKFMKKQIKWKSRTLNLKKKKTKSNILLQKNVSEICLLMSIMMFHTKKAELIQLGVVVWFIWRCKCSVMLILR